MNRFFVNAGNIKNNKAYFEKDQVHHIVDVLRIRPNEKIIFFDGTGNEYAGLLRQDKKGKLFADILEKKQIVQFSPVRITLCQAIPKKDKMDLIVEKATELNVDTIIPVVTDRCLVQKTEGVSEHRMARWEKIAVEASKQCGRLTVPVITKPKPLLDVLREAPASYELTVFATLSGKRINPRDLLDTNPCSSIIVFIGPEGDFSEREIRLAQDLGLAPVNLFPITLKVETASLFILSILNLAYLKGYCTVK